MSVSLLILFWLILVALSVPVSLSLGMASALYLFWNEEVLLAVPQRLVAAANSFPLLAAPFFIFAGNLMNRTGITDRIFHFAQVLVGHIPGGMGHTNVAGSMIFSGMTGAAVADAGGLGAIEIKAMRERGYDARFSAGITAASSTIGPIIPPSVPMVFYGVLAGVSIGGLFVAGIIPGLLMGGSLMAMVYYFSRKKSLPTTVRPTLRELVVSFKEAFLPLMTPVLLLGGIISGVFTPTEAAVVASLYTLFLGGVIYGEIKGAELKDVIISTVETTAVVMLIVMAASLLGWILTRARVPQEAAAFVLSLTENKVLLLIILNLFLLFVGCFVEALAAMTILVPVLMPIVFQLDMDPIHFGIILILNLMIGTLTPPLGIVLYVVARVSNLTFQEVLRGTLPFLVPLIFVLILVTYWPAVTLFLPKVLMGIGGE